MVEIGQMPVSLEKFREDYGNSNAVEPSRGRQPHPTDGGKALL
ncbi:MAG: hypothetical protein OXI73_13655 [Rhodospirillales bacterium]|nr:hypothetical protein [Rhodospirillales bacterium]MCY4096917.1 hypothetical protein [Rhodospirillales bacterium]MDE0373571.1 hypothetical protein [Rhodospirillales bacterium]